MFRIFIMTEIHNLKKSMFADKSGVHPDEAVELVRHIQESCPKLALAGIMTIGAFDHDLSQGPNPDFQVWLCLVTDLLGREERWGGGLERVRIERARPGI